MTMKVKKLSQHKCDNVPDIVKIRSPSQNWLLSSDLSFGGCVRTSFAGNKGETLLPVDLESTKLSPCDTLGEVCFHTLI